MRKDKKSSVPRILGLALLGLLAGGYLWQRNGVASTGPVRPNTWAKDSILSANRRTEAD